VKKRFYIFLPIYCSFFVVLGGYEIIHPPFSSDSITIGENEIKIETDPAVPEVGKNTKIHLLVLDKNGNPLDSFRIGLQIYYNDNLLRTFTPSDHYLGKYDQDYIFNESGNHVIRIDLFDLKSDSVISHAFNIGVLNFYMELFKYLVIAGLAGASGIVIAIILFQRKISKKRKT